MAYDAELGFDLDERYEGFSRDAKQAFREELLAKKDKKQAASQTSAQWTTYIDDRINQFIDNYHKVLNDDCLQYALQRIKKLEQEVSELKKTSSPQKIVLYDPSEAMKKQIQEFAAPLLKELADIKRRGEHRDPPAE